MLCPFEKNLYKDSWVAVDGWGKCEQGFRRMAARNKPAGIRSLVYGMSKGKVRIEGLSVSGDNPLTLAMRRQEELEGVQMAIN
jgi:hypothetical protein